MQTAARAAEETGALVTIGIKPTWACPGFGYIEQGAAAPLKGGSTPNEVFRVVRFREKPNSELADSFFRRDNFRWNAGMFVWSVPTVLSEFNRHAPELADFISQILATGNWEQRVRARFAELPVISFDYAIMEKANRVLMVEASFDWDDVGGWRAVASYCRTTRSQRRQLRPHDVACDQQHRFHRGRNQDCAPRRAQSDRRPDRRRHPRLPSSPRREDQELGRQASLGFTVSKIA